MMRRVTILILFVACANVTFAAVYYVGGSGASDNNPGTPTQPFATIQKAASVAVAGDIVTIRSGIYRETIVPTNSGTPGNPIIYQPEPGAVVTISGLNTADGGWSIHSGNIYKKSITLPVNGYNATTTNNTTLLANQVFKDGVMMFEARWPDLNKLDDLLDRTKVRSIPSTPTSTTIVDSGIPNIPGGWVGATIWVNGWYMTQTGKITSHSGSTISFTPGQGDAKKRRFYYLTGKLGALTQEKEWHYESGTLYFWQPGGGSPTGVEYKARNYGFDLTNRSSITIQGLQFFGCTPMHGNTASTNITIDNIRAKYLNHAVAQVLSDVIYGNPKQTGIKLIGANSIIKNSELQYAASQAIWLGENCTADNNLIRDISYEGNYGAGVTFWENTANQTVTNNTIYRLGRSAVDFGYTNHGSHLNVEIGYNDFYGFGMLNLDLGATYAGRGINTTGLRIHHNWIHDSKVIFDTGINTGIYFDQAAGPCTSDHNVLWNNVQSDYYTQIVYGGRTAGSSKIHNNVFGTVSSGPSSHSYKTPDTNPVDVQRNNIYRQDIQVKLGAGTPNLANVLLQGTDPQFLGTGNGGLAFRLKSTSPGINKGVVIPGITDGSVGVPDIGAYEYGGTDWVPGYTPVATSISNTPPVVSLTSPATNATFAQGSPITFSATASDANGSITRVEFFYGTTKAGEDLTSPYALVWNNAPAGTHILTAKATDNASSTTTSSPVTITVNGNTAPTVALTGPAHNAQFIVGTPITITAAASDTNGSVAKVEFFSGTTKIGEDITTPYSFAWNSAAAGTHILTAKATDNATGVTTSTPVTIDINTNTVPTVSITGPAKNAQFVIGSPIAITATAADANGSVTKVEFFSGTTKLGEDLTTPYSFAWNNAIAGTHILTAKATDNAASVTTSTAVTITVASPNTAPTVSITGPSNNAQFTAGASISITATASDTNGSVTKVEFFDGTAKLGEDLASPYSFAWVNATAGTHVLTAKATDNTNNVTTSTTVSITVISPNTAPTVSLTGPSNNAQFTAGASITITATASDTNGTVTKVEFYRGTTKLGEDTTSPYSFVWANVPAGNYSLVAKATDNQASTISSTPISITVSVNTPPVVSLTSPANNSSFDAGSTITLSATASDANGTVSKVEFFNGIAKLGEDVTSPYSFIWNNVSAGSYSLAAKATDNQNAVSTSSSLNISVNDTNVPIAPTAHAGEDVFLTLPNNSLTLTAWGVPDVPDGPSLQFNWAQLSGPNTIVILDPSLKEIALTNLIEGTYVFQITVTDPNGLTDKDEVAITVSSSSQILESSIPRFFSPNDDGNGDFWEWSQSELFENSSLTVFNQFGHKIYEAVSYNNTWDGKLDGKPLQEDAYYYIVKLPDRTEIKGAVRIVR